MSLPNELDTGVSNGDVDWLFRGKSKKLTKKLTLEARQPVSSDKGKETKEETKEKEDEKKEAGKEKRKEVNHVVDSDNHTTNNNGVKKTTIDKSGPMTPTGELDASEKHADTNPKKDKKEKDSPVRARSNSAPQPESKPTASPKRRTPVPAAASSTPAKAEQPAAGVTRSNSGRKSFFSSLSSKFKSSSSSLAPVSTPGLSPATSRNQADLAAAVTQPPVESGARAKTSPRLSLSVEREKGSFFRRRGLVDRLLVDRPNETPRMVLNRNPARRGGPVQLRRVAFALDRLEEDPQQQIPSRRPRKGNVLIPEDLTAPLPRLAQGILASDGRAAAPEHKYTEEEIQKAVEAQQRARLEAEKHATEAHLLAKKLAVQIAQNKILRLDEDAEDGEVAEEPAAENIEIDKPVHLRENYFEPEEVNHNSEEILLEAVYTRCCHLREILPIPATLRQLKNKTSPLQVLKLLNPKPTLIDVLSFSDFIAITPINTVIFDNVTMTTEMLKHLLAALVHNKNLEKLSLRNVAIDDAGWLYLCEFLSRNATIKKLDISQQRVKQVTKQTSFRSAMNWDLFIKTVIARGGIEELVMGGCKLLDDTFQNLLQNALSISTCRLGMAATEINVRKCELVADWISRKDSKCVGIDLAFNDLSQGQLRPFIDAFSNKTVKLIFFSLNSTELSNVEEVGELLRGLANVKTLKFLDMSSLPQLFPKVISKLSKCLPLFACLKRIHFDLNELTSESIEAISDIFPKVNGLVHVSLLGNRNLDRRAIVAIYTAVKRSAIFTLDLDYDLVPDDLSQRLALYLMRNMDRTIRPDITNISGDTEQDDVMFDGSLLMERAERMLIESEKNLGETDYKLQKIITNALIERTNSVRKDIHKIIDSLFTRRDDGSLTFEEKENLLRFCLLDASLEKVIHMFEQKAEMFSSTPLSPSPSVHAPKSPAMNAVDHDKLHESSSALIDAGPILMAKDSRPNMLAPVVTVPIDQTFQPHSVVVEANSEGRTVPIDNFTGRPVLLKSMSQTSIHAKEQELEEGEFHRWGYFMEHRNSTTDLNDETKPQALPVLTALPSGSELREAIIDAKGIDSVTQLITKINDNRVSLDKIYHVDHDEQHSSNEGIKSLPEGMKPREAFEDASQKFASDVEDAVSIDSNEEHAVHSVVNDAYDKLLNEAQRVRSNK